MKALFSKSVFAGAVAALGVFATAGANAQETYPYFTVDPQGLESTVPFEDPFKANKLTGNYTEVVTFGPNNTFNVSLIWQAGQFVDQGGVGQVNNTGLNFNVTIPGAGTFNGYGLYAVYKASGTTSFNAANGETKFTFLPSGVDSLQLYYDANANTTYDTQGPATGTGDFTRFNFSDDFVIATGKPLTGSGTLDPLEESCINGNNCGSFGSTTSFALNEEGKKFFIAPNPFYSLSFQSGQLNNFDPSGRQVINGSLDVTFMGNAVPEPASLGLLGLGLLGLSAARRRKQAK